MHSGLIPLEAQFGSVLNLRITFHLFGKHYGGIGCVVVGLQISGLKLAIMPIIFYRCLNMAGKLMGSV